MKFFLWKKVVGVYLIATRWKFIIGMTDYLIASAPRHIGWLSLLMVVTTMFANAEAAMPPQLAVANE